ncbi:DUF2231 domain-containing protein [Chelativorans sp. AA-79]|uniref:DUF2231 domain-containing protein n=1 Tax=Chelativorans sp. AA-79 TaxID=3028735 RepID=UPI0023F98A16|nr:DUF2231 domain-containing protein [Chelativorans sp. AA-79]WEX07514.1 DUF2231 domain-containing protein [Chelativorans sp. AA-79]
MTDRELLGIASTAKLGGHPIHPMLIPFPIALFTAVFASDLAFWATADTFWADASLWLLGAGLVMSAAAAVAGFTDFLGNPRVRAISDAWHHMIGNVVAVTLASVSFIFRIATGADWAVPWGLALSAIVFLLLVFTGWKGGALVYQHRVGVHPEAEFEDRIT